MDFKKATELFADPDFDGDPVVVYTPKIGESPVPPDDLVSPDANQPFDFSTNDDFDFSDFEYSEGETQKVKKYYVADVPVSVVAERVQYFDADGKLITESLKDYTKKTLSKEFSSLDDFLKKWSDSDKKKAIITALEAEGVFFDALAEEIGKDLDPFDIICHVAWDMPPLTRKERADQVKKRNYFTKYGEQAQNVINALLEKYADEGVVHIEETKILTIQPFTEFGTPLEIIKRFGGLAEYEKAIRELEQAIYTA